MMTPMEHLCMKYDKIKGHISELYMVLTNSSEKLEYMKRWEADLQESIKLDEWYTIAQGATKSIIVTSLIEANNKIIMRWYMVLASLATFIPEASPRCFRGCGRLGTMYHVWWQCPKVRHYWIRVYNFMYTLTQVNLVKSPRQALSGTKVESVSKFRRRLIAYVFTVAKIIIAKSWKSAVVPFNQLKYKLSWIMLNERMTATLTDKMQQFEKIWSPWIRYLKGDPRAIST